MLGMEESDTNCELRKILEDITSFARQEYTSDKLIYTQVCRAAGQGSWEKPLGVI